MRTFQHFQYALLLFSVIQACSPQQSVDREAVKNELASREIKRISQSERMEKGLEMGKQIAAAAQQALQKNLKGAIDKGGMEYALTYCNQHALFLVKELEDSLSVDIMRVSQKFRNPKDEPDSLENLILDAYQYSLDNGLTVEPAIMEDGKEVLLFTQPILISNTLCLTCHGAIGTDISEENYDTILGYYPKDSATGYAMGQLRGMWAIRIPTKTIVNSL